MQRGERGRFDVVSTARLRDDDKLLVIVDQFEERSSASATTGDPAAQAREAGAFAEPPLTAAAWPDLPVYVAITMRAD